MALLGQTGVTGKSGGLGAAAATSAIPLCNVFAATTGSDANAGSVAAPFRTAQKLVSSLTAGQTGCLQPGVYTDTFVLFRAAGSPAARITLTSADPSNKATLSTQYVAWASSATYSGLDGVNVRCAGTLNQNCVQMHASGAELRDGDVDGGGQQRIGVSIGWSYKAVDVKVIGNRIHGFGVPGSSYNHDIYDNWSDGTEIAENYLYDAGGYLIQLWTSAQNSNIHNNTLDHGGIGSLIAGGDMAAHGQASSGNDIHHNIFTNPGNGQQVAVFWGSFNGSNGGVGNKVHDNIYWGGSGFEQPYACPYCVAYANNRQVDPQYRDRLHKDFTALNPTAACYGVTPVASDHRGRRACEGRRAGPPPGR